MNPNSYLESRKITQTEFAKMLGITKRSVWNYLNGVRMCPLNVAKKIEEITNGKVTFEDMLEVYEKKSNI